MLGLLGASRLVADEIDIELRKADHLQARLFEYAVEHTRVVRREQVQRAIALARGPELERGRDGRRIALEIAMQPAESWLWCHERQTGAERERVSAAVRRGRAGDVGHQSSVHPLGHEVGRDLVHAIRIGLTPGLEQVSWLAEMQALNVVALDPAQVLEPADHVV